MIPDITLEETYKSMNKIENIIITETWVIRLPGVWSDLPPRLNSPLIVETLAMD
jgi:hypothetical protein